MRPWYIPISQSGAISRNTARILRLSRRYGSRLTCWVSTLGRDATHFVRSPVNVVPVSSLGVSLPEGSDMLDHKMRARLLGLANGIVAAKPTGRRQLRRRTLSCSSPLDTIRSRGVVDSDDRVPLDSDEGNVVRKAEADLFELFVVSDGAKEGAYGQTRRRYHSVRWFGGDYWGS